MINVTRVFENLLAGSEKHLAAFNRNLGNYNADCQGTCINGGTCLNGGTCVNNGTCINDGTCIQARDRDGTCINSQ